MHTDISAIDPSGGISSVIAPGMFGNTFKILVINKSCFALSQDYFFHLWTTSQEIMSAASPIIDPRNRMKTPRGI